MLGSFTAHITSNKADAFIVVGLALTVWSFGLYYAGGLAIRSVSTHSLNWLQVVVVAAALLAMVFLLWQITVLGLFVLCLVLLVVIAIRLLPEHLSDKSFKEHLKAGSYMALAVGFWLMGLVMILQVLTGWQTAALTIGLTSFGVCAWRLDQTIRRWEHLEAGNRRVQAVAVVAGFLALGVTLIGTLIVTS